MELENTLHRFRTLDNEFTRNFSLGTVARADQEITLCKTKACVPHVFSPILQNRIFRSETPQPSLHGLEVGPPSLSIRELRTEFRIPGRNRIHLPWDQVQYLSRTAP